MNGSVWRFFLGVRVKEVRGEKRVENGGKRMKVIATSNSQRQQCQTLAVPRSCTKWGKTVEKTGENWGKRGENVRKNRGKVGMDVVG